MVSFKLYIEGGGDSEALRTRCREGFRGFLEKAGFQGHMPRIVACGGRQSAYDRFTTACESNESAMLLIDSECGVCASSPWEHLSNQTGDGFAKPANATDAHCHLILHALKLNF